MLYNGRAENGPRDNAFRGIVVNAIFEITLAAPVFSAVTKCPDFVTDDVKRTFDEAATCFAVAAYDASGAMFRKVLDVTTRPLIGVEPQSVEKDHPDYISFKQAKDLRLRLDWLFERGRLPVDLKELVSCVHLDGNDAAHSAETIGKDGALDLRDFTISILETLFTRPGRIADNMRRRDERRGAT